MHFKLHMTCNYLVWKCTNGVGCYGPKIYHPFVTEVCRSFLTPTLAVRAACLGTPFLCGINLFFFFLLINILIKKFLNASLMLFLQCNLYLIYDRVVEMEVHVYFLMIWVHRHL